MNPQAWLEMAPEIRPSPGAFAKGQVEQSTDGGIAEDQADSRTLTGEAHEVSPGTSAREGAASEAARASAQGPSCRKETMEGGCRSSSLFTSARLRAVLVRLRIQTVTRFWLRATICGRRSSLR